MSYNCVGPVTEEHVTDAYCFTYNKNRYRNGCRDVDNTEVLMRFDLNEDTHPQEVVDRFAQFLRAIGWNFAGSIKLSD